MKLPDVNVLVSALRPDAPDHETCRTWLTTTANHPSPFALTSVVLSGAVRVLTHPRVFDPPSRTADVLAELQRLRAHPTAVLVEPGPRHWTLFTGLCEQSDVRGNLVPDAWLAALAIEHGCTLVTRDRDFARFDGLAWETPG